MIIFLIHLEVDCNLILLLLCQPVDERLSNIPLHLSLVNDIVLHFWHLKLVKFYKFIKAACIDINTERWGDEVIAEKHGKED
jgi:hypothetical protein